MALLPLDIKPGVFRNGTAYQSKGRWYDANLVRWRNGQLQPIGGWQRITPTPLTGKPRRMIGWRDNSARRLLGIGTSSKLYVFDNDQFYDITPVGFTEGRENSIYGLGWGASRFGDDAYGTERASSGLILDAATWTLDLWGQNLVGCAPHDGKIYEWAVDNIDPIDPAVVITNAPTDCRAVFVTSERHLVALGADGDPRKVAWSDQEDNTVWTAAATNAAGDALLVTNGLVQCGRRIPGGSLIWTDADVHLMTYIGQPFVYSIEKIGEGGIVGPNAYAAFGNAIAWMGDKGFWIYDGVVKPLDSEVRDYIFTDINMFQAAKITAGHLNELGEIWWFYPSANSLENDRYVIWNYREGHWTIGQLSRSAWIDAGTFTYPTAAEPNGHVFSHEQGWTNNGATRVGQVYAKTAPLEIGDGDRIFEVRQLIPDGCPNVPTCTQVEFEVQQTPMGPAVTKGPYNFTRSDGYADARFSGRQIEMTVKGTQDAPFRFGTLRLDAVPGSGR